jgi:hypothetical protein
MFHLWEWWLFFGLNVGGVALSYVLIPCKLYMAAKDERHSVFSTRNSRLFASFILACGIGHIVMPAVMWIAMSWMEGQFGAFICAELRATRPTYVTLSIYFMILWTLLTACVSWEAFGRLKVRV